MRLGAGAVTACGRVRLLGVIVSAGLGLDRHVSVVGSASFCWLRRLRRVRRSLDGGSAAMLVRAFVASWVDCCGLLLTGAPGSVADGLQRVVDAAARVVGGAEGECDLGLKVDTPASLWAALAPSSPIIATGLLDWLDVADRVACGAGLG